MKKFFRKAVYGLIFSVIFLSSCVPLKDFVYIQGEPTEEDLEIADAIPYRLQPDDNLFIQVISNDELAMYFNIGSKDQYLNSEAAIELSSYKVDINGDINFPYIGKIKVVNKTTEEVKDIISKYISEKLVEYSVVVKLVNRSVSLLGEFKSPGTYSFFKDRLTIFEAIGLGRDLTDLANRHNVRIIRHQDGKKIIETLDLTDSDILKSSFYFILPNDIIYVEPSHKFYESKGLSLTATVLGAFSTLFNIYYIIDRTLIPGNAQ